MAIRSYSGAGVKAPDEIPGFKALLQALQPTFAYAGKARPVIEFGYYANVIPITAEVGVAISTDGVGTKVLVAQALGKYDTIGIDCVAMNVNDIICVGARPLAMVDYLAIEEADDRLLAELGKGLARGAELSGISIPGGELAQVREMIRGNGPGTGFDLVGTCIGSVNLGEIITGKEIKPGDVLVGVESSGIHSNGFTLGRRAFADLSEHIAEFGRTAGEELLEPTTIYVKGAMAVLEAGIRPKALAHITGDGYLNLLRVEADISFEIDNLPETPPVFRMVQERREVPLEEMYRVFNMGLGFVAVVDPGDADTMLRLFTETGYKASVIGRAVAGDQPFVRLTQPRLLGDGASFTPY